MGNDVRHFPNIIVEVIFAVTIAEFISFVENRKDPAEMAEYLGVRDPGGGTELCGAGQKRLAAAAAAIA